jgi:hypothetical protein
MVRELGRCVHAIDHVWVDELRPPGILSGAPRTSSAVVLGSVKEDIGIGVVCRQD